MNAEFTTQPRVDGHRALGIDLGNVIIDHNKFGTTPDDLDSNERYCKIPPTPCLMQIVSLLHAYFIGNVFVVYKATDVADERILAWIEHHQFCQKTGIKPQDIVRTPEGDGRDKSRICQKYGATHFVDDRAEVLGFLAGKVPHLFLFNPRELEVEQFGHRLPPNVQRVPDWFTLHGLIMPRREEHMETSRN